jgi:hypothetical protein
MRCSIFRALILAVTIALASRVSGDAVQPEQAKAAAERLVAAAVQAQMSGDVSRSFALLHEAIRIDPENLLARSQIGEMRIGNQWVSVEEAQRRAAADPRQAEYRERRMAAGDSPQGRLSLARWCRKNNLIEEARFHWANVLSVDPKNKEALAALDLRWHNGRLAPRVQTARLKNELQRAKQAAERWEPKLVKWRRAVSGRDAAARDAALAEIRTIDDIDAIPSLEAVTLGREAHDSQHADSCVAIGLALLDALGKMEAQAATESLVRHGVFAPGDKVRASAIEKLKPRDLHDYVPMLLSGLGMPIEMTYSLTTGPDGSVHFLRSLYREGPESDWSWESRRAAVQRDLGGRMTQHDVYTGKTTVGPPSEAPAVVASKKAAVASAYQNRYATNLVATEAQLRETNQSVETLNALIVPVLKETTGKDFGDNPKAWWDWWRGENEYYAYDHPVERYYDYGVDRYHYGFPTYNVVNSAPPPPPPPPGRYSCFVKGTQVWTKTGQRPIETIEVGDLVLSQNVDTSELKYVPVLARTVRPPSPIVKFAIGKEEMRTTRGHLFWVSGTGWRMAKELQTGERLHGLNGPSRIQSIESDGEAEAYNLIVANFDTYFVGEHGLLVHDNKPRNPTNAIVPGFIVTK